LFTEDISNGWLPKDTTRNPTEQDTSDGDGLTPKEDSTDLKESSRRLSWSNHTEELEDLDLPSEDKRE